MKKLALSLNVKNATKTIMNEQTGTPDFQVGLNEDGEVTVVVDGVEFNSNELIAAKTAVCTEPKKIRDYAYDIWYNQIDYRFANEYFRREFNTFVTGGKCSAVRAGDFVGRSMDWNYGEGAEFIVHVPRIANRYANFGTSTVLAGLTDEMVKNHEMTALQKNLLPFMLVDGLNEKGVYCNANVVPTDRGINYKSTPEVETRQTLSSSVIIRFILDNFATAKAAAEYIRDYVSIYPVKRLIEQAYEEHFIICDESGETYLLEVDEGRNVIVNMTAGSGSNLAGRPYMTNFLLNNVRLNTNGKVYTPEYRTETRDAMSWNNVTAHGAGLERYNLIVDSYASLNSKEAMRTLLNNLLYTHTYKKSTSPFWYSEYVGGDYTVASTTDEFQPIVDPIIEAWESRSRKQPVFWHTTHSCIYDLKEKKMYVVFQENTDDEITINSDFYYSADDLKKRNAILPPIPSDDGVYKLQATVSNGVPTLEWVSSN